MRKKLTSMPEKKRAPLYERIRQILESARFAAARSVNTAQVVANWLIGREIVEEEQRGRRRAGYGEQILEDLSIRLTRDFGASYSVQNLRFIRQLYLTYPMLLGDRRIRSALRSESATNVESTGNRIPYAVRAEFETSEKATTNDILHALRSESWQPGQLYPNLSWTHYRTLLNYYDHERRTKGDSPTLGLILCTDKNDAVVRYTLAPDQLKKIFASRYKLHLPTEGELQAELRRELRLLKGGLDGHT